MRYVLRNKSNPQWLYLTEDYETCVSSKCRMFRTRKSAKNYLSKNSLSESYLIEAVSEDDLIQEVNSSLDRLYDAISEVEARSSNIKGATNLTSEVEELLRKLKKAKAYLYGDFRPSFYSSRGDEYYSSAVPSTPKKDPIPTVDPDNGSADLETTDASGDSSSDSSE